MVYWLIPRFSVAKYLNSMHKYALLALITAIAVTSPAVSRAQEGASADGSVDASTQADLTNYVPGRGTPPPQGRYYPPSDRPGTSSVKNLIRNDINARMKNLQTNQDIRENKLANKLASTSPIRKEALKERMEERKAIATSTRGEIKDIRKEGREDMRHASSTEDRREARADMRLDIFAARKAAIVGQLNISLSNLTQIRGRISSRIDKLATDGKDMTKPKALLATADLKLAAASQVIASLAAFSATSSTTTTTDMQVNLGKPREIGDAAIRAVNEARKALNDVVVEIVRLVPKNAQATTTASVSTQ